MRTLIAETYSPSAIVASWIAWLVRSDSRWSRLVFVLIWEKFFHGFEENGKAVYIAQYQAVRKMVPKERLLEWRVDEGWGPICEFLGHDVPPCSFPNGNDEVATKQRMRQLKIHEMRLACRKLAVVVAVVVTVTAVVMLVVHYA